MDAALVAEITALAAARYPEGFEQPSEQLFALLVDVADAYMAALQAEEPLPGRSPSSDIEMTCVGLEENLIERYYAGRS
jgi:hypothetical protein